MVDNSFLLNIPIEGRHVIIGIVAGLIRNRELHLITNVFHGIQRLSYHFNGLRSEVGEERQGHNQENRRQSRRANQILEKLLAEQSVGTAGVEHHVARKGREERSQRHRTPNHDDSEAKKPLPEVHAIHMHELQGCKNNEERYDESRESEVDRHEVVRRQRTDGTAIIGEFMVLVEPFSRSHALKNTLVGLPGIEIRHHGNDGYHSQGKQKKSCEESCGLAL